MYSIIDKDRQYLAGDVIMARLVIWHPNEIVSKWFLQLPKSASISSIRLVDYSFALGQTF